MGVGNVVVIVLGFLLLVPLVVSNVIVLMSVLMVAIVILIVVSFDVGSVCVGWGLIFVYLLRIVSDITYWNYIK